MNAQKIQTCIHTSFEQASDAEERATWYQIKRELRTLKDWSLPAHRLVLEHHLELAQGKRRAVFEQAIALLS